ncbi:uncharacterized protein EAF02_006633 [Botrytis sinoallii]|uniref:uncharacterized protein n=1 Tax=Botrytis sinoallii TaxID=1463999 RepID=UPI0019029A15|nr:uncharacterized protein EAF02_006633 [Botrytis sinoallii]KAF7881945.1 hypothetical protein EAF02_006633 [Botrytis sinoallii]
MATRETPFAGKYGHPQGPGHEILREWLPLKKSGLTPASPSVVDWRKLVSADRHRALEDYQRTRFWGFTAHELEQIGALADIRPGKWDSDSTTGRVDLGTVPIHPIFERQHWEREDVIPLHFPKHPYGDGNKFWEIKGNDEIWEAIQPALKIVTLVLSNVATWQWFDALLNGMYQKIPDDELPAEIRGSDYWRFYPSNLFNYQERTATFNEFLNEIVGSISWGFGIGQVSLECFPQDGTYTNGITVGPRNSVLNLKGTTFILIAHDLVEPLLNPNLLPEDRALNTFHIVSVVLHELTHAMVTYLSAKMKGSDSRYDGEPYFMDEPIAETGFSMQSSVFGGIDIPLVSGLDLPGKSCGGIVQFNFPSVWFGGVSGGPVLPPSETQKLWDIRACYPVPVDWFMGLHDQNFWGFYLRAFGPKATHMGPKIVGQWNFKSDQLYATAPKGDEDASYLDVPSLARESEMVSVYIENARRRRVKKIMERAQNISPKQPGHYHYSQRVALKDKAPYSGQTCPRYDEIKKYFEDNRTALGLGAMKFIIPSPLLRSYVVRHGGINLTNLEWTNFFVVANGHKEMFTYSHAGHGMIGLIKDGWRRPEIPIGPKRQPSLLRRVSTRLQSPASKSKRDKPQPPSDTLAKVFAIVCSAVLKKVDPLEATLDFCKNNFRITCNVAWGLNRSLLERKGYEIPDMPNGFPEDSNHLDRCIYWSDLFDNEAPEGMIRRMRFEAPALIEPELRGRKKLRKKCVFQSQAER